ncbi:MAG: translation initiation factor [Campylobacterales bacterium]
MGENLFEMGASWSDNEWSSDNREKKKKKSNSKKDISKHKLKIRKEKRRGKDVTIIEEFYLAPEILKDILKEFKKKLGVGGTIKDNLSIEFQGDIQEQVKPLLRKKGFPI